MIVSVVWIIILVWLLISSISRTTVVTSVAVVGIRIGQVVVVVVVVSVVVISSVVVVVVVAVAVVVSDVVQSWELLSNLSENSILLPNSTSQHTTLNERKEFKKVIF